MQNKFQLYADKMEGAGLGSEVIAAFKHYYEKLLCGEYGILSKEVITEPSPDKIIEYENLPAGEDELLSKLAVIKLNGGLGTSMGLDRAKSLLRIKENYTFLDIIARQILYYRKNKEFKIPLLFMNSFNTSDDTLQFLSKYSGLKLPEIPLDFLQNKFPKIEEESLLPFSDEEDRLNWNPPGHGEIYMVLKQSGVIDLLLAHGYRYIFISNSDNLGAVVDSRIVSYMANRKIPFIMEVCYRTEMDKKGGHLAGDKEGRLILRESAQCPGNEREEFEDVSIYRYFNTNNLWLDLEILNDHLISNDNFLALTPIMNHKKVKGKRVIQLESAMGSAISLFNGSQAVVVERSRFIPVKKTNEFLVVLSDAYKLTDDWRLMLAEGRTIAPQVNLDTEFYTKIGDFEDRIAEEVPSLVKCRSLRVKGDIYFGENVEVRGDVSLTAKTRVRLENKVFTDGNYEL